MKRFALVFAAFLALALSGCAVLDWIFGVKVEKKNGVTTVTHGPAPIDPLGELWGPIGGIVASLAGGAYFAYRKEQEHKAKCAAVDGVQAIKDTLTPDQMAKMAAAQDKHGAGARQRVRTTAHESERISRLPA